MKIQERAGSETVAASNKGSEAGDHALGQLGELMERWDNRLTLKGLAPAERYVNGDLRVLVDLDVTAGGEAEHLHAIFYRSEFDGRDGDTAPFQAKPLEASSLANGNEAVVLVCNVEVMDGAQRFVPSLVRLQRAHFLNDLWAGSVYVSLCDGLLKAVDTDREGELNALGVAAVASDEFDGHVVEGAPEVVHGLAKNDAPYVGNFLPNLNHAIILSRNLRVCLSDQSVRASFDETCDLRVQVRDVMLGPLNL